MIVGINSPRVVSWSTSGVFSTDVKLSTPNPGEVTRITFAGGSPSQLTISGEWSQAQSVRVIMCVGLAYLSAAGSPLSYTWQVAPAGVKVTVAGKRFGDTGFPYALGGNSLSTLTKTLPNGTTAAMFVLDAGLSPLVGIQITIEGDVDGAPWLDSLYELEVGGIYPFTGVEVPGAPGWAQSWNDPTLNQRTLAGQMNIVARQSWREYSIKIPAGTEAEARGEGLQESMDYEKIANALRYKKLCCVIPYYKNEQGVFDEAILYRNGMVGVTELEPLTHVEKRLYSHGYRFLELPALEDLP